MMKKLYIRPMMEATLLSVESNFMVTSPFGQHNGGLEKEQNDNGGTFSKKYDFWSFDEEEPSIPSHDVLSDSF